MKEVIYSSDDYEVPQTRKRVIIFGVRKDNKEWLFKFYQNLDNLKSKNHRLPLETLLVICPSLDRSKRP